MSLLRHHQLLMSSGSSPHDPWRYVIIGTSSTPYYAIFDRLDGGMLNVPAASREVYWCGFDKSRERVLLSSVISNGQTLDLSSMTLSTPGVSQINPRAYLYDHIADEVIGAFWNGNPSMRRYNADTFALLGTFPNAPPATGPSSNITGARLSHSRRYLGVTSEARNRVYVYDLENGRSPVSVLGTTPNATTSNISFSSDGSRVAVTTGTSYRMYLMTGGDAPVIPSGIGRAPAFHPSKPQIFLGANGLANGGEIKDWMTGDTVAILAELPDTEIRYAEYAPDGNTLAVATGNRMILYETLGYSEIFSAAFPGSPLSLTIY